MFLIRHGRIFIILVIYSFSLICQAAEEIVISGIKYILQKDNTLTCVAVKKDELINVELPSTVKLNGIDYYLEGIKSEGFSKCKNLRSIVIPNTVKRIGAYAFFDCKNLETVVMPDEAEAIIFPGNFGVGKYGIFKGCNKLTNVSGHDIPYPKYVIYDAFYGCNETPFYNTITEEGSIELLARNARVEPFSAFAESRLKRAVEEWQCRKSYETIAQWNVRVNDETRQNFISKTLATIKHEYIAKFTPRVIHGQLGEYASDYGYFPVNLGRLETVYVAVPEKDKDIVISNWQNVSIEPKYGIMDDMLAVLSCEFVLSGNTYHTVHSYAEDDFAPLVVNITPLNTVREYEISVASNDLSFKKNSEFIPDVIDINIPKSNATNQSTFAIIIGNENYQRVAPVDFATNDAQIFEKYCVNILGIPEHNIRAYYDATFGDISAAIRDLQQIVSTFNGEISVIFYYAGHGIPDESNRNAYILPIDAAGDDFNACYSLSRLCSELSALNVESVIAFIDACFSGSVRGDGMLASTRGVMLKHRALQPTGNLIVFSAAANNQSALPYNEKGHGIFTYYLLEKLNTTNGDIRLGELTDYIINQVSQQSIVKSRKLQTPTVSVSHNLIESWKDIKLK